jgi:hypothetical protein
MCNPEPSPPPPDAQQQTDAAEALREEKAMVDRLLTEAMRWCGDEGQEQ